MAQQCFTGPGYLRLLNNTSSFKVVNTLTGVVIGSFNTPYKGKSSSDKVPGEMYIPSGQHCAEYPDNWGTPNCDCPAVPVLDFILDTSVIVQQVLNKLNEACDGSPINVNVCNQIDLTNIGNSLNSILLSAQAIDSNTDNVETLLQTAIDALALLDSDDDAVALATINTSIQKAISELQTIDTNTDNLEALLTALNTSLIAKSDETQILLTTINNTVQAVVNKLSEDCTGSPINVRLCVTAKIDQTHAVVNGTNINIPVGTKSVLINNLSGITTVNGGFELGNGRRLVSISYDATTVESVRGLLPAFTLTGGTYQWTAIQPISEQ